MPDAGPEITEIPLAGCDPLDLPELDEACAALGVPRERVERGCRFVCHVLARHGRGVIHLPCGAGKSTSADALILRRAREAGGIRRPVWLVVDTLAAGQERIDRLVRIGVDRSLVGFYHSHWARECHGFRSDCPSYSEISRDFRICGDCYAQHQCLSVKRNRRRQLRRKIVVLTHEGFVRLHELGKVPPDADILIDEEISNFYMARFPGEWLDGMQRHIPYDTPALAEVRGVVNEMQRLLRDPERMHGSVRWERRLDGDTKRQAIRDVEAFVRRNAVGSVLHDHELEAGLDEFKWKISRLGYALAEGFRTFAYADDGQVWIARDRMNLRIPNRVLLLNGSAACARFPYESMPTFSCPDLQTSYSNVTVVPVMAAPTKKWLAKEENLLALVDRAKSCLGGEVFVAVNKGMSKERRDLIAESFPEARFGTRGSIVGSNEWRALDGGLVATSLFTTMAAYALMASIRNDREYASGELFRIDRRGIRRPWFLSNRRLACGDVDREFMLHSVYELHQTVMRLSCREQRARPVTVVLLATDEEMLAMLGRLMPGFRVAGGDGRFALSEVATRQEGGIPNRELYEMAGLDPGSARHRQRVEAVMPMHGWTKVQEPGVRGNRKAWVKGVA